MKDPTTWPKARLRVADADAVRRLAQQLVISSDEVFALAVHLGVTEIAARAACGVTAERMTREADQSAALRRSATT